MKLKFIISALVGLVALMTGQGQNVHIPDPNFKAYLIGNPDINTDGDTEISVAEAQAFTGAIWCQNKEISDLTGIEAFVNITELWCFDNKLSGLDLGNNTALIKLGCGGNKLSSLDVSNNTALKVLRCSGSQLRSLDVSNNTGLIELMCGENQLVSLDLSNNKNLKILWCGENDLRSVNLKNGYNRNIVNLDLTKNPNLRYIQVDNVAYSNAKWSDKKDATASFVN